MPFKYSFIFICILTHFAQAQSFEVQYESVYDGTLYHNQLHVEDSFSIWELIPDPLSSDHADELLVQHYSRGSLLLIDYIFQKKYYVKDSLHPMQWELQPGTKNILGHTCHSARTFFRGRNYTAYFTKNIPIAGGPWKLGGLPGLILEVVSSEGNYSFRATDIQPADEVPLSAYDLHEKEALSWQEYCHQTILAIQRYVRYMQTVSSNPGSQVSLRIERPEIIYPLAQTGAGISSE